MEHISKDLGSLERGAPIQNQKTVEELEPTREEKLEELRKNLGMSSLENTFENFKPLKGTRKAKAAFKALAEGTTDWRMLLCYGGVGNGKTHLCEAAAITLYKRGLFCRVLTMDTIMGALKKCIGSDWRNSLEASLRNYSYAARLILDDVVGTEWEFEQLEKIIRVRYREHLFTILTSNLDLDQLPERIVSRFEDPEKGRLILNEGVDYRRLK